MRHATSARTALILAFADFLALPVKQQHDIIVTIVASAERRDLSMNDAVSQLAATLAKIGEPIGFVCSFSITVPA